MEYTPQDAAREIKTALEPVFHGQAFVVTPEEYGVTVEFSPTEPNAGPLVRLQTDGRVCLLVAPSVGSLMPGGEKPWYGENATKFGIKDRETVEQMKYMGLKFRKAQGSAKKMVQTLIKWFRDNAAKLKEHKFVGAAATTEFPKVIPAADVVKVLLDQPGNKGLNGMELRKKWIASEKFYLAEVHVGLPELGVTPGKPGVFVTEAPIIIDQNIQGIARGAGGVGKKSPPFMVLDGQNRTTAARKIHGPAHRLAAYVGEQIIRDLQQKDRAYGELARGLDAAKEKFLASADMPGFSPGSLWPKVQEYEAKGVLTAEDVQNIRAAWQNRKSGTVVSQLLQANRHEIAASLLEVVAVMKSVPGHSVGIFARLPNGIASQFPPRSQEDQSRPHITVVYIGDVDPVRQPDLVAVVRAALQDEVAVEASLAPLDYFPPSEHSDGKKVAITPIDSPDLHGLNARLLAAVEAAGFETPHSFPEYRPHATLAYIDEASTYQGTVPSGRWQIQELELWGFEEPVTFKLM